MHLQEVSVRVAASGACVQRDNQGYSDHSNTQIAMLARYIVV